MYKFLILFTVKPVSISWLFQEWPGLLKPYFYILYHQSQGTRIDETKAYRFEMKYTIHRSKISYDFWPWIPYTKRCMFMYVSVASLGAEITFLVQNYGIDCQKIWRLKVSMKHVWISWNSHPSCPPPSPPTPPFCDAYIYSDLCFSALEHFDYVSFSAFYKFYWLIESLFACLLHMLTYLLD